jgi:peptidoglycan/LPS O-acetylase OafA/YrhL
LNDLKKQNLALTSIRGVAAMCVVLFHLGNATANPASSLYVIQAFRYGEQAVDLFFILSGFIMATVYWSIRPDEIWRFLLKRIFRLYPLHFAVLGGMVFLVVLAPVLHMRLGQNGLHSWSSLPFAALLIQSYFPSRVGWNVSAWSIGVELLCYLLLPVAMRGLRSALRLWMMGAATLLLLGQISLLFHFGSPIAGTPAVLRGIYGFFLGVSLRILLHEKPNPPAWMVSGLEIVAVLLVATASWFAMPFVIPAIAALLIVALSFETGMLARLLQGTPWVWLGEISFSIYLVQEPLFRVVYGVLPLQRLPVPMPLAAYLYEVILIGLTLLAASFTYYAVEQPGRRIPGWLFHTSGRSA